MRTLCVPACVLSLSAGLGGAQADGPGPDQRSDRPGLAPGHPPPPARDLARVCGANPSSQDLEGQSWSPGQGCPRRRQPFHYGLPYACAAGADSRTLVPRRPSVNVPGYARDGAGAHPCAPPLSRGLGRAQGRAPGQGFLGSDGRGVAPFACPPGRCSLHRDNRDGCPSRSSRYTGVGALPFNHHVGLDGTTTDRRAMLTIASGFAALARMLIHGRVRAGLARARVEGRLPKRPARCTSSSRRRQPTARRGGPDRLGAYAAGADDRSIVPRRPFANVPVVPLGVV